MLRFFQGATIVFYVDFNPATYGTASLGTRRKHARQYNILSIMRKILIGLKPGSSILYLEELENNKMRHFICIVEKIMFSTLTLHA
jgi:hypothetical protein